MEVYCTAPYWVKTGGSERRVWERGGQTWRYSIIHIKDLWFMDVKESWEEETAGSPPCCLNPKWRKPKGGAIFYPTSAFGCAVRQLYLLYSFIVSQASCGKYKEVVLGFWLRATCYFSSPPSALVQDDYARQTGASRWLELHTRNKKWRQPFTVNFLSFFC